MVITKDAHIAVFDVPNDLFDVVYVSCLKFSPLWSNVFNLGSDDEE